MTETIRLCERNGWAQIATAGKTVRMGKTLSSGKSPV